MNLSDFVRPFNVSTYRARRQKLIAALAKQDEDFVCIFWSGSELTRTHDQHFPFRANSDFLYLTGFSEPDTLMILRHSKGKTTASIGIRPRDLSNDRGSEIWEGERLGVERAPKALGFDDAFDIHLVNQYSEKSLAGARSVYWNIGLYPDWDQKILGWISKGTLKNRGIPLTHALKDSRPILHEMRKVKSAEEIEMMRRSANIASQGHIRAMAMSRPGHYEYQVAAELEREFKRLGAQTVSYSSIVAGGANACTLHYHTNEMKLKSGELLLIDAGAEFEGYASDITRTFPINGKFSKAQKEVYEIVLESQLAALAACKAGVKFFKPHEEAAKSLSSGLKKLGFFKSASAQSVFKKGLWKKYMPHGTSHWLGIDVHDLGRYQRLDQPKEPVPLPAGSVITIEPGLYFRKDDSSVPTRYRGIGIRIEDDVHITAKGPDVLTEACPKSVDAIEAACGPKL